MFPRLLTFLTKRRIMVAAGGIFSYLVWKFVLTFVMDCVCTYSFTCWTFSWTTCADISFFCLTYDEAMHSPLSKQSQCGKTSRLTYIFLKFTLCQLLAILEQWKFRLWPTFLNHHHVVLWYWMIKRDELQKCSFATVLVLLQLKVSTDMKKGTCVCAVNASKNMGLMW